MLRLFFATVMMSLFEISRSLGGTPVEIPVKESEETGKWDYSISTSTYLALDSQDYANPNITADHGWLHLEGRYNYEALKTGSIWLGYNFSFGDKLTLDLTPMLGGVFGNLTGIAPGYTISASYGPIEFFTQGEYFFETGNDPENFFYNWSELSCSLTRWFRVGFVLDRTKTLGSDIDIRRGPLVGFRYKEQADFTAYWLSPGSTDQVFVFAVTLNF